MNGGNQPGCFVVVMFQGNLTGRGVLAVIFDPAASHGEALLLDAALKGFRFGFHCKFSICYGRSNLPGFRIFLKGDINHAI